MNNLFKFLTKKKTASNSLPKLNCYSLTCQFTTDNAEELKQHEQENHD